MKIRLLVPMTMLAALALPLAAQAQGTVRGAEEGAAAGGNAAGPISAICWRRPWRDDRYSFRHSRCRRSPALPRIRGPRAPAVYTYPGEVRTGVVLTEADQSMTYRLIHAPAGYRYTVINGRPVLIEARSRRIVEVY